MRLVLLMLALAGLPLAASAQGGGNASKNVPPGTVNQGIVDIDQLSKLQNLTIYVKDIVVRTILPPDWKYTEGGRKKGSSQLDPEIGWYTLTATPPTESKETDFVYELWVRSNDLLENLDNFKDPKGNPINIPAKDRNEKAIFALYLNGMISGLNKMKYKTQTRIQNIKPVPYGVIPAEDGSDKMMLMGSRPEPMYFTPIKFKHSDNGSTLYTFSGVIGDKIVSMRFLVAKDQEEYYESTIALILNNTWGLTLEQNAQWAAEMQKKIEAGKTAQKSKPKSK